MFPEIISFTLLWITCTAEDYYYYPYNVTRSTLSGIAAYRSALTLDWLAAEDNRQRELAAAFETEAAPPSRILTTECIAYPRPSTGKVARLMLELLKNLEGDDARVVPELVQMLIHAKLLLETSILEAEPDLEALVKTPGVMMGEPHVTFPRILAMLWLTVTDPGTTRKSGWCPINRVNRYIAVNKPNHIANKMRALEPIVARARFIIEEFIQSVTPLNMYKKASEEAEGPVTEGTPTRVRTLKTVKRPIRYYSTHKMPPPEMEQELSSIPTESDLEDIRRALESNQMVVTSAAPPVPLSGLICSSFALCCLY